jgi:hypothetical protein
MSGRWKVQIVDLVAKLKRRIKKLVWHISGKRGRRGIKNKYASLLKLGLMKYTGR